MMTCLRSLVLKTLTCMSFSFSFHRNFLGTHWPNFTSHFCVCGQMMEHLKNLPNSLINEHVFIINDHAVLLAIILLKKR